MNKITKLILGLLKENKLYVSYINNKDFIKLFNNISIPWANNAIDYKFKKLYDILNNYIDIKQYRNYTMFNNIIIYNIKNVEKLFNYFINNGIVWGCGNQCTINSIPKGFNPLDKGSYFKLYGDICKIYYGKNYHSGLMCSETTLTEEEFYEYYEKYKKRINDNFERFLKK